MLIQEPKGGKTAFVHVEDIEFCTRLKPDNGEAWVMDEWECVLVIFYSPDGFFNVNWVNWR